MPAIASPLPVVSVSSKGSLLDGVSYFTDSMPAAASGLPVAGVHRLPTLVYLHSPLNEPLSLKPEYLGIKWLETVWERVPKPRFCTVVIGPVAFPWLGVEGGEWDHDDEEAQLQLQRRAKEKADKQHVEEQELDHSVTKVLHTLAKLLEIATLHGLVTVDLADAISRSLLLADYQDQISLDRIKAIICPLLVPLPSTPPPQLIRFSCHMELL
jgi:hypothetical protein